MKQEQKMDEETEQGVDGSQQFPQEDSKGNQEKKAGHGRKAVSLLWELAVYAMIFAFCFKIVPQYVIQRTIVDGSSMERTLQDRDNVLVEKVSYYLAEPKRFDVVVFDPGAWDEGKKYIKRIIGLPGETIQIQGDTIWVDGEILEESYGKEPMTDSGIAENPVTLGKDEYFVLGDNREVSKDSRTIGAVSRGQLEGKAVLRIYPLDKFGQFE